MRVLGSMVRWFFFQAEDGIRDVAVTGVQTCALPIYEEGRRPAEPQGLGVRKVLGYGDLRSIAAQAGGEVRCVQLQTLGQPHVIRRLEIGRLGEEGVVISPELALLVRTVSRFGRRASLRVRREGEVPIDDPDLLRIEAAHR